MPLTKFQSGLARLLSKNRTSDSHLAGGAAINLLPNSHRFSNDLDFFHDSEERVAESFAADRLLLLANGYEVRAVLNQPGFIRAVISKGADSTKVEWARDSSWRFMPVVCSPEVGFMLHPIDLAINKLLALAGRDEARDFLDILEIDREVLTLGALCWAAPGKDPGFTPLSLLEIIRRRGRYQQADFDRLITTRPVDLKELKGRWLVALEEAEKFIRTRPADEIGCLYYSPLLNKFVTPKSTAEEVKPHYGRPGGVLPVVE